jgi:bifunctional non-homologous end joining protein LigD
MIYGSFSLPAQPGGMGRARLLCPGALDAGRTSFSLIQSASDTGTSGALVYFLFDLLHLDGDPTAPMPLTKRKERLHELLSGAGSPLHFSDHQIGRGRAFYDQACALKVEGIVSKRVDAPYAPGNRGLWSPAETAGRIFQVEPAPRLGAGLHCTP